MIVCPRALEMLQEINQSVNRSSFSKLAMTKLLSSNLPVKYSLLDHLTSSDIISDGFYDAGKVCIWIGNAEDICFSHGLRPSSKKMKTYHSQEHVNILLLFYNNPNFSHFQRLVKVREL